MIRAQNVPACTTTHCRDHHPATGRISLYPQTVQRVIRQARINRELNDITGGTLFDFSLYIQRPRRRFKNKNPEKVRKNKKKVVKNPHETCLMEVLAQGTKSDGQTPWDNALRLIAGQHLGPHTSCRFIA